MLLALAILMLVPFALFAVAMAVAPAGLASRVARMPEEERALLFLTGALAAMALAALLVAHRLAGPVPGL